MRITFFDANPHIVRRLRSMDHTSRTYQKALLCLRLDLQQCQTHLFSASYLRDNQRELALHKRYFQYITGLIVSVVFMVAWIIAAVILTSGKELSEFGEADLQVFAAFVLTELVTVALMLLFASRCRGTICELLSLLVDHYELEGWKH